MPELRKEKQMYNDKFIIAIIVIITILILIVVIKLGKDQEKKDIAKKEQKSLGRKLSWIIFLAQEPMQIFPGKITEWAHDIVQRRWAEISERRYHFEYGMIRSISKDNREICEFDYYDNGLIREKFDENRELFEYKYDENLRLKKIQFKGEIVETFEYDDEAKSIIMTDSVGKETKYLYKTKVLENNITILLLKKIEYPNGKIKAIEYNENYWPIIVSYPSGAVHRFKYDEKGRLIKILSDKGDIKTIYIHETL